MFGGTGTPAATKPLFGTTSTAPSSSAFTFPSSNTPSTGALFGGGLTTSSATPTLTSQANPVPATGLFSSQPAAGLLFSAAPQLSTSSTITSTTTATPLLPATSTTSSGGSLFSLGSKSASNNNQSLLSGGNLTGSSLKSTGPSVDEKQLLFGDLETVVNNLTMEVAHLERSFLSQALEINAYDRVVRENEKKLINADKEISTLEASRDRLNYNLGFIDEQHTELEQIVSEIEKKLGLPDWTDYAKPYPIDMTCASPADEQRRKIMQLLTTVDAQLKEAGDDIDEIIGQVSALLKEKENVSSNVITVEHIQKVLKKQLENLVWLDNKSEELNTKTMKLSRSLNQDI